MKQILLILLMVPTISFCQWNQTGSWTGTTTLDSGYGFSTSTNANGDIVAIGAPSDDNFSTNQGRVEVQQYVSGAWQQIGSSLYGNSGDEFGTSLSLNSDGTILAVGSSQGGTNLTGSVKVYKYNGTSWNQIGSEIVGINAGDNFGVSVSLNGTGDVLVVGSRYNQPIGSTAYASGYTRVFINISNTWIQIGQDIYGEAGNDEAGFSVSISKYNNIIAIGAPGNNGNGSNSGHVRVFEYNISTNLWVQLGLDIDGQSGSSSGYSIDMNASGSTVVIGAPNSSSGGATTKGRIRVYEYISGVWTHIGTDIIGTNSRDRLGYSVSIDDSGNIIACGAIAENVLHVDNIGYASIYQNIAGTWTQIDQAIVGQANAEMGTSVCLNANGSKLSVGSPKYGANNNGRVQLYENTSVLGVSSFYLDSQFSIFPNPVKNVFNISTVLPINSIKIFDLQGKMAKDLNPENSRFDISDLSEGLYIIKIRTSKGFLTKKLVKN